MTRERRLRALQDAITAGYLSSAGRQPGVIVERLPEETRALLRDLTADDLAACRVEIKGGQ